ncbi:cyclic AMP response element-binding protein A [Anoplophora glabripennis]|uniref:cyclic AMP response element-binding protein A n=1 Tax=Anoplophora glabripennis TaxID=217634 RepID=UPI0008742D91|nr:cyclic AMP response element-binding protein A [Anoplophora glabripennis]
METFAVDKSFYDIDSADELKELWEADLDPAMQEVLKMQSGDMTIEWTYMDSKDLPAVVLHDRLMTDAALGTRPIKTEHSYSLASDGDSLPNSPISHHKVDDMEDECFPAISMNTSCVRLQHEPVTIKDEPTSETDSPHSSCPSSPQSIYVNASDLPLDVEMSPPHTSILKSANIMLTSPHTIIPSRLQMPTQKLNIKIENGSTFHLPPTPPSCSSSEDSEDNATISQPSSPAARKTAARMVLNHHTSTRQPINTPLISSQPKGSTGTLVLTEEEKRTLIAEGYPVPTRLPLTKAEEKSLKKIRRKIKNKISAQESRRKKKEYMDQLERKVEILVSENNDYRQKIESLEDSNSSLLSQLQKLQAIVARTHPQIIKQLKQNN